MKPKEIIELEKQLEEKFIEVKDANKIIYNNYSYLLNREGKIIGLNLGVVKLTRPITLKNAHNLKYLSFRNNGIESINNFKDIENLEKLKLFKNNLSNISFLKYFPKLKYLDLSYNKISNIDILSHLTELRELDLEDNLINNIGSLQYLSELDKLNISRTQVSSISNLQNLPKLKKLNISNNKIKDIFILKECKELSELHIINNKLKKFDILQEIINLTSLYLDYNNISDISFLKGLTKLVNLSLCDNNIVYISELQNLENLQILYLDGNQISKISLSFLNSFPKLKQFSLARNPTNFPKEIFDKYTYALQPIRDYLEGIEQSPTPNKDVKIILIGNGCVGKTQIAKRLAEKENFIFENLHKSTQSIALLQRELKGLQLNIWDLAGQDIYHATHRLFMQTRALFVLVWDIENENQGFHEWEGRKYKNEKLQYWLEYATFFGKGSPILVVQNKVDTEKQCENKNLEFIESYYKDKYPIVEFVQTSAKTAYNFDILEYWLAESFKKNEKLKQELLLDIPTSWATIRTEIRNLQAKGQKILTLSDFKVLCEQQDIAKAKNTLLGYLHDTNVFYYKENYFNNQIIINQAWAIEAIYAVLDRQNFYFRTGKIKKGVLQYADLQELWKNNSDEERKLFIDFMLSAELCFETTDSYKPLQERIFVAPQLLPENKPKEVIYWTEQRGIGKIPQERTYSFLPSVYMQLFIVRANTFAKVENMWQSGVLLEWNNCYAVVEADYGSIPKKIMIYASPNSEFFVEKIVEELENITDKTQVKAQKPQKGFDAVIEGEKHLRGLVDLKKNDNFENKQNHNTMYGKNKEILDTEQIIDALIEKTNYLRNQLVITSDAETKFSLRKKIENLDTEIAEWREKLNKLVDIQDVNKIKVLPTTSHKTNSENMQTKIYFSYAWGDDKEQGESREKIVNDLYDSLATDGYKLVRDKVDLGYKGYISDFMQEIGKGDIIIVAVSQKYAKSPFCMFELYEIARNCGFDKYKFRDKVVPIMVEFVDFAKPKILDEHLEYWENEYTEWENLVTKRARQLSKEQFDRYDKIKLVHQNFGKLADWLVDMNTLNPKLLSADNFAIIKSEIEKFGK